MASSSVSRQRRIRWPRLWALILHDARLQRRYGIWYAYAFVIAFYVLMLQLGGTRLPPWLKVLVLYTDPSVFGFFFLGAVLLLEKSENARAALAVTPVSASEYFWAKTTTLTLVALFAVLAMVPFLGALPSAKHGALLIATLALTSIHYIGLGVPAALHFKSVTSYLVGAAGWLLPIMGPGVLAFLQLVPVWALAIPSVAQIALLRVSLGAYHPAPHHLGVMQLVCLLAAWGGAWVGVRCLEREFGK